MCADGTIVQEVFRGYEWEGELLRKPRVLVARGADSTVQEE
jgi:molecular chaperone GrpE (heat shock protein)